MATKAKAAAPVRPPTVTSRVAALEEQLSSILAQLAEVKQPAVSAAEALAGAMPYDQATEKPASGVGALGASLIRTWMAVLGGWIVPTATRFVAAWGVQLDATTAVTALTAAAIGAWYTLLRLVERRWPRAGWLLGLAKQPGYPATATALRRQPSG